MDNAKANATVATLLSDFLDGRPKKTHVLITTRESDFLAMRPNVERVTLDVFSEDQAYGYLETRLFEMGRPSDK